VNKLHFASKGISRQPSWSGYLEALKNFVINIYMLGHSDMLKKEEKQQWATTGQAYLDTAGP
jgi:hypothetical protein